MSVKENSVAIFFRLTHAQAISVIIVRMVTPSTSITPLIIEKLGEGEKRSLTLVVAIRKSLGQSAFLKGDLSAVVNTALRKLVAAKKVIEVDGVYSLAHAETAAK